MARNADAMQIETGRERLIALFGLVPRESSCCSKLLGSLLTPPTVVEFEEGASVGNSPIPTNSVVVPLVLVVVVPVLLATVVAALVSVATLAVAEVAAGETVDKIWCIRDWLISLRPSRQDQLLG